MHGSEWGYAAHASLWQSSLQVVAFFACEASAGIKEDGQPAAVKPEHPVLQHTCITGKTVAGNYISKLPPPSEHAPPRLPAYHGHPHYRMAHLHRHLLLLLLLCSKQGLVPLVMPYTDNAYGLCSNLNRKRYHDTKKL